MNDATIFSAPIEAAGAVVWRGADRLREVALVHRPKYGDWSFPKGKVKHGEHVLAAADREVREETGLSVRLGAWLGRVGYTKQGWPKQVDYWTARHDGAGSFRPSAEVDALRWVSPKDAALVLTREEDRRLLETFAARPVLDTTSLVLLRHGEMEGKGVDWKGRKKHRPLDAAGLRQADTIMPVLDAGSIDVLHSADSVRCLQTLRPYAVARGLPIRTDKRLRGKHFDLAYALRLAGEALDGGRHAVLCAHRTGLTTLYSALCRQRAEFLPDDTDLPKAGFVVLHGHAGKILHIEQHRAR